MLQRILYYLTAMGWAIFAVAAWTNSQAIWASLLVSLVAIFVWGAPFFPRRRVVKLLLQITIVVSAFLALIWIVMVSPWVLGGLAELIRR